MDVQRVQTFPFFADYEGIQTKASLESGRRLGIKNCHVFVATELSPDCRDIGMEMRKNILAHSFVGRDDGDDMNHFAMSFKFVFFDP